MTDDEEQQLLIECAQGNEKSFGVLYSQYAPLVYRFIYKFVKSAELSDDLLQEVFIKIWENRLALEEVRTFKSYVFKIAKNHTLNILKRASRDTALMGLVLSNYKQETSLEDELSTAEYIAYLEKIIAGISPQSRRVFRLCRQENKSYEEVAHLLGISKNAVKKHMVKSMRIITKAIKKDLGIPLSMAMMILHGDSLGGYDISYKTMQPNVPHIQYKAFCTPSALIKPYIQDNTSVTGCIDKIAPQS